MFEMERSATATTQRGGYGAVLCGPPLDLVSSELRWCPRQRFCTNIQFCDFWNVVLLCLYGIFVCDCSYNVKNLLTMQETWVRSLGWEDPLEKEIATDSCILPGEFHGQRSLGSERVRQDWEINTLKFLQCIIHTINFLIFFSFWIPSVATSPLKR